MIGLDISDHSINAVEFQKKEGILYLKGFAAASASGSDTASLARDIAAALGGAGFTSREINLSVCGPFVAVRTAELPDMTDREIKNAVGFEAEKLIPFKIEESILDYQVLERDPQSKKISLLIAAAKKDFVQTRIAAVSRAGFSAKCVDIDGLALANAFLAAYPQKESQTTEKAIALLNVADTFLNLCVIYKKYPVVLRDIPGLKDTSDMDKPVKEIRLSMGYFENQSGKEVETVYLSGSFSKTPGLAEFLSEAVEVKTQTWDPFAQVKIGEGIDMKAFEEARPRLAVAAGLAMRND